RAPFEALWRRHTSLEPCRTLEFPTSFALGAVWQHARRDKGRIEARPQRARARLERPRRDKTFNLFNGGLRPHRLNVLAYLHQQGLLEDGFVSMLGYSKHPGGTLRLRAGQAAPLPDDLRHQSAKMSYEPESLMPSLEAVWRMTPMTLDLRH